MHKPLVYLSSVLDKLVHIRLALLELRSGSHPVSVVFVSFEDLLVLVQGILINVDRIPPVV